MTRSLVVAAAPTDELTDLITNSFADLATHLIAVSLLIAVGLLAGSLLVPARFPVAGRLLGALIGGYSALLYVQNAWVENSPWDTATTWAPPAVGALLIAVIVRTVARVIRTTTRGAPTVPTDPSEADASSNGEPSPAADIVTSEWRNYGKHRFYANDTNGRRLGYLDVPTGQVHLEDGTDPAVETALREAANA